MFFAALACLPFMSAGMRSMALPCVFVPQMRGSCGADLALTEAHCTICFAQVTERLATVKQTRELLLQNPNSTGAVPSQAEAVSTRCFDAHTTTHALPCPFCAVFLDSQPTCSWAR